MPMLQYRWACLCCWQTNILNDAEKSQQKKKGGGFSQKNISVAMMAAKWQDLDLEVLPVCWFGAFKCVLTQCQGGETSAVILVK